MAGLDKFRPFFKWFRLDALAGQNVKPCFLKTRLSRFGVESVHVIERG